MAGWSWNGFLGMLPCIDTMKVKSNMDMECFWNQKGAITALNSDKSWFNSMNEIYKNDEF
jgi:hypothetical protein